MARAGTTTPFHTGATISTAQANYDGLSAPYGPGVTGQYRARPIAAGSLSRNAFGLYDVHGNVGRAGRRLLRRRGDGLHQTRRPRRLVGIQPPARAFGLSKLVRSDPPQLPQRLPGRPGSRHVTVGCEAIT